MAEVSLKELFLDLQGQMLCTLNLHRRATNHPVEKGDATEVNWCKWMKEYLPKRYTADKAYVVDSAGSISEQIDMVIYDRQYSLFVFNQNGTKYIPAESVYAVFEIKQELNKSNLEYAGKKAHSVRNLHRTSAAIPHAGGTFPPKVPHDIIAGILATSCSWKPALGNTLKRKLLALPSKQHINLGCVLADGSFCTDYSNNKIDKCNPEESLMFFFLSLVKELQSIATVPAIDVDKYLEILSR